MRGSRLTWFGRQQTLINILERNNDLTQVKRVKKGRWKSKITQV